jgi:hypothetical protein
MKHDGGKARPDLLPFPDFEITDDRLDLGHAYEALKIWFHGAPFKLEVAIPRAELQYVARVLGFGAAKYVPRGWEAGIAYSRIFAAAARHAEAHARGDYLDEESGLPHASHFWCNVLFLVVFTARGRTDLDDRPTAHPAVRARLDRLQTLVAGIGSGIHVDPTPKPGKDN